MKRTAEVAGMNVVTETALTLARQRGREGALDLANSIIVLDEVSFLAQERAKLAPAIYSDVGKALIATGVAAAQAAPWMAPFESALGAVRDRGNEAAAALAEANTGLANTIETMMMNMDWIAGGGKGLQDAAAAVQEAALAGTITPEQADAMFEEIQVAAIQLQTDIGMITPAAAAQEAAKLLGTDYRTAADALKDVKTRISEIPTHIQSEITVAVQWYLQGQTGHRGYAHGGQFKVGGMGGTDTTLVNFMASPGELVTVTPPGRSSSIEDNRAVNVGNVNVNNGMSAQAFDTMMRSWLGA
jgi:hypothetical protein